MVLTSSSPSSAAALLAILAISLSVILPSDQQGAGSTFFPPSTRRVFQGPAVQVQQPAPQQFREFSPQAQTQQQNTNFFSTFPTPGVAGFSQQQFPQIPLFKPGSPQQAQVQQPRRPQPPMRTFPQPTFTQQQFEARPPSAGASRPVALTGFGPRQQPSRFQLGFQRTLPFPQQQQQQQQQSGRPSPQSTANTANDVGFPSLLPFTATRLPETDNMFNPAVQPVAKQPQQQLPVRPQPKFAPRRRPASVAQQPPAPTNVFQVPGPVKGLADETVSPSKELPFSAFSGVIKPEGYDDGSSGSVGSSGGPSVGNIAFVPTTATPQVAAGQPRVDIDLTLTPEGLIPGDKTAGGIDIRPSGVVFFQPVNDGFTRDTAGDFVELPLTEFFLDEVNTGIVSKEGSGGAAEQTSFQQLQLKQLQRQQQLLQEQQEQLLRLAASLQQQAQEGQLGGAMATSARRPESTAGLLTSSPARATDDDFTVPTIRPIPRPVTLVRKIENGYTRETAGEYITLPLSSFFLEDVPNKGPDVQAQVQSKGVQGLSSTSTTTPQSTSSLDRNQVTKGRLLVDSDSVPTVHLLPPTAGPTPTTASSTIPSPEPAQPTRKPIVDEALTQQQRPATTEQSAPALPSRAPSFSTWRQQPAFQGKERFTIAESQPVKPTSIQTSTTLASTQPFGMRPSTVTRLEDVEATTFHPIFLWGKLATTTHKAAFPANVEAKTQGDLFNQLDEDEAAETATSTHEIPPPQNVSSEQRRLDLGSTDDIRGTFVNPSPARSDMSHVGHVPQHEQSGSSSSDELTDIHALLRDLETAVAVPAPERPENHLVAEVPTGWNPELAQTSESNELDFSGGFVYPSSTGQTSTPTTGQSQAPLDMKVLGEALPTLWSDLVDIQGAYVAPSSVSIDKTRTAIDGKDEHSRDALAKALQAQIADIYAALRDLQLAVATSTYLPTPAASLDKEQQAPQRKEPRPFQISKEAEIHGAFVTQSSPSIGERPILEATTSRWTFPIPEQRPPNQGTSLPAEADQIEDIQADIKGTSVPRGPSNGQENIPEPEVRVPTRRPSRIFKPFVNVEGSRGIHAGAPTARPPFANVEGSRGIKKVGTFWVVRPATTTTEEPETQAPTLKPEEEKNLIGPISKTARVPSFRRPVGVFETSQGSAGGTSREGGFRRPIQVIANATGPVLERTETTNRPETNFRPLPNEVSSFPTDADVQSASVAITPQGQDEASSRNEEETAGVQLASVNSASTQQAPSAKWKLPPPLLFRPSPGQHEQADYADIMSTSFSVIPEAIPESSNSSAPPEAGTAAAARVPTVYGNPMPEEEQADIASASVSVVLSEHSGTTYPAYSIVNEAKQQAAVSEAGNSIDVEIKGASIGASRERDETASDIEVELLGFPEAHVATNPKVSTATIALTTTTAAAPNTTTIEPEVLSEEAKQVTFPSFTEAVPHSRRRVAHKSHPRLEYMDDNKEPDPGDIAVDWRSNLIPGKGENGEQHSNVTDDQAFGISFEAEIDDVISGDAGAERVLGRSSTGNGVRIPPTARDVSPRFSARNGGSGRGRPIPSATRSSLKDFFEARSRQLATMVPQKRSIASSTEATSP